MGIEMRYLVRLNFGGIFTFTIDTESLQWEVQIDENKIDETIFILSSIYQKMVNKCCKNTVEKKKTIRGNVLTNNCNNFTLGIFRASKRT